VFKYPKVCSLHLTTRCDHHCHHCVCDRTKRIDADLDQTVQLIRDFRKLGGIYLDLTGGNPVLVDWLYDVLKVARDENFYTSITVSGPRSLKQKKALLLPNMVRVSLEGDENYTDQNRNVKAYLPAVEFLAWAQKERTNETQIIWTAIPGVRGNINDDQFGSVLKLARKYEAMVNINPLFGGDFTQDEMLNLRKYAKQAGCYFSLGKSRFIMHGGNNPLQPTCLAASTVTTISADGYLVLPCFHNAISKIPLTSGLQAALDSEIRKKFLKIQGRLSFCDGCSIWCYIVPSWYSQHVFDRIVVWQDALSRLQSIRDFTLKSFGKLHLKHPYPDFKL